MARYHALRFDIWVCLLVGFLVSFGTEALVRNVLAEKYEEHKAQHVVEAGGVGGKATEETLRAENVEDLLANENFTVVSEGIKYQNEGGGFFEGMYLNSLELPSGERVAARINGEAVTRTGDSVFSGEAVLPVGRVVEKDLASSETFLSQIEYRDKLSRKDFYVDMVGGAEIQSEESFIETPVIIWQLLTIMVVFAATHFAGSKLGLFPAFYTRKRSKEEKKSDWD